MEGIKIGAGAPPLGLLHRAASTVELRIALELNQHAVQGDSTLVRPWLQGAAALRRLGTPRKEAPVTALTSNERLILNPHGRGEQRPPYLVDSSIAQPPSQTKPRATRRATPTHSLRGGGLGPEALQRRTRPNMRRAQRTTLQEDQGVARRYPAVSDECGKTGTGRRGRGPHWRSEVWLLPPHPGGG